MTRPCTRSPDRCPRRAAGTFRSCTPHKRRRTVDCSSDRRRSSRRRRRCRHSRPGPPRRERTASRNRWSWGSRVWFRRSRSSPSGCTRRHSRTRRTACCCSKTGRPRGKRRRSTSPRKARCCSTSCRVRGTCCCSTASGRVDCCSTSRPVRGTCCRSTAWCRVGCCSTRRVAARRRRCSRHPGTGCLSSRSSRSRGTSRCSRFGSADSSRRRSTSRRRRRTGPWGTARGRPALRHRARVRAGARRLAQSATTLVRPEPAVPGAGSAAPPTPRPPTRRRRS